MLSDAWRVTREKFGPAAGAAGGRNPFPVPRQFAPEFLTLSHVELEAMWNKCGNAVAERMYPRLAGRAVFKGPRKGFVEGPTGHPLTYAWLQEVLRPPKPEKGQWPAGPTLKQIRTALDALQAAGLIARDRSANQAQGQLHLFLPHRADASAAERAQLRHAAGKAPKAKPSPEVRDARAQLQTAADALRVVSSRPQRQRAG